MLSPPIRANARAANCALTLPPQGRIPVAASEFGLRYRSQPMPPINRGYRPSAGLDASAATSARQVEAERIAQRLMLEIADIRDGGVRTLQGWRRS